MYDIISFTTYASNISHRNLKLSIWTMVHIPSSPETYNSAIISFQLYFQKWNALWILDLVFRSISIIQLQSTVNIMKETTNKYISRTCDYCIFFMTHTHTTHTLLTINIQERRAKNSCIKLIFTSIIIAVLHIETTDFGKIGFIYILRWSCEESPLSG
jgi:hypothetical protein